VTGREWTHVGEHLPWLRGQGFHVAAAGTEPYVGEALAEAGFTRARARSSGVTSASRFHAITSALRLPVTASNSLDALADALFDLTEHWPAVERLCLLWSAADELMHVDLLSFVRAAQLLSDATDQLWADQQFVFETIAFVPAPFGADRPA